MSDIKALMKSEITTLAFTEVLGSEREARGFISSVLIAVSNSEALQKCDPQSIMTSAMRAATLRLSVDPALGQAYLVPYKGKCTFQPGYRGLRDLALRTNQYRFINVANVYEGEEVTENRMTGIHSITGGMKSHKIIGYLFFMEMFNGYQATLYQTVEEIHAHASRYAPSYNNAESLWKKNQKAMERKTTLRAGLMKHAPMLYGEKSRPVSVAEIDRDPEEDIIDAEASDAPPNPEEPKEPPAPRDEKIIIQELGF